MSVIHRVLSQAESNEQNSERPAFNPLKNATSQSKSNTPYYLVSFALLFATLVIIFFPILKPSIEVVEEQTPVASATAETDTAIVNEPSIEPEQDALSAPITITSTNTEPSTTAEPTTTTSIEVVNVDEVFDSALQTLASAPSDDTEQTLPSQEELKADEFSAQENENVSPVNETTALAVDQTVATTSSVSEPSKSPGSISEIKESNDSSNSIASAGNNQKKTTNSVILRSAQKWQSQTEEHIGRGEIEKAEAVLKQWISATPNDPTPRIWLAKIYINNGFFQAAEPLLIEQTDTEAQGLLGLVFERTQRPLKAASTFESLFRANPDEGKWLLFWAINAENSGQVEKSTALYQNYLALFPSIDDDLVTFATARLNAIQRQ